MTCTPERELRFKRVHCFTAFLRRPHFIEPKTANQVQSCNKKSQRQYFVCPFLTQIIKTLKDEFILNIGLESLLILSRWQPVFMHLQSLASALHYMGDGYASEYIIRRKQKYLLEIQNKGRMHFCRDILLGHHKEKTKIDSIIKLFSSQSNIYFEQARY